MHISTNVRIKSKKTRWEKHVARMYNRNTYVVLVGKPEGKKPLRRLRHRWKHNIKWILNKQDGRVGWV